MKIKINLKEIREDKGLFQTQLAKKANVRLGVITRIEQNLYKNPSLIPILQIAKALDVSIYDLIEIQEED
jgi:transcriptional regulator with XRE-family HTH domain